MKTLSEIMNLLNDILDDRQKKYHITIDRLDENWVNDDLRYLLVRALLDTIRDFNHKIENVKIIVAIREDLLGRVFRYTRGPGYQEEKYKSLYLSLTWDQPELEELIDIRVSQLVKERYTSMNVRMKDLLPAVISKKQDSIDYFFARTMLNPRDAISFFNECIKVAEGKPKINQTMLFAAEGYYSLNRLRYLADEWISDYSNLIELSFFLKKFPKQFKLDDTKSKATDFMVDFMVSKYQKDDIYDMIEERFNNNDVDGFLQKMFKIFFKVGIIGIKEESYTKPCWSYQGQKLLSSEISNSAVIHIHPAFWRVLGVRF